MSNNFLNKIQRYQNQAHLPDNVLMPNSDLLLTLRAASKAVLNEFDKL